MNDRITVMVNNTMNMIEPIIHQEIDDARLKNPLSDADALTFYDFKDADGRTFESSVVKAAESRGFVFVADGEQPDKSPTDPTIYTKYFEKWDKRSFDVTTRYDEIRAVNSGKGTTREEMAAKIVNSLTQGDYDEDFIDRRNLIFKSPVFDYSAIIGGKVAKTMRGVVTILRDMYTHLISANDDTTAPAFRCAVPANDVRIAITNKLFNLIDVVQMANAFNLSKTELFGKLVIINVDDLPASMWYQAVAYDKKALNVCEYIMDYTYEDMRNDRYINHRLTVEREYIYNSLFKACKIDCSKAAAAAEAEMLEAQTTHKITATLNNVCTLSNTAEHVGNNMPFATDVIPAAGTNLDAINIVVNMGGNITAEVYDEVKGEIIIPVVTAPVTITATAV